MPARFAVMQVLDGTGRMQAAFSAHIGVMMTARRSASPSVLILGTAGQVGAELQRSFAGFGSVVAVDREAFDLADPEETRALIRRERPDVILNAAAYTAVDGAESEPEVAMAINGHAPRTLAEEAQRANALLVHYSTDYVFDGTKRNPWLETDEPNPLSAYGASKLAGERAIKEVGGRYLIFRTSWVYGPHGRNFLQTMLRLAGERDRISIVDDQIGSPTSSHELARATRTIVEDVLTEEYGSMYEWAGLYHMTCTDEVTWFGFAQAIFARAASNLNVLPPELIPIRTEEYPTAAKRPQYSVLSNQKLFDRFGVRLATWQEALDEVFKALNSAP
jgi:dTDP-4-dehydrorhamnose reductase